MMKERDGFTLPGEAGYEALTLRLAERWGADVIRDSDGTKLSQEIIDAGYGIYSTICIIREHNEWAIKNMNKLQQCFLMTRPIVASQNYLTIYLMEDFFEQQFKVNSSEEAIRYWQVFDRTTGREVDRSKWNYDVETGNVVVSGIVPWHKYTVNFLAYRIWEEISMYNHTTNHWDKEHLMQIDPIHPETQQYLLNWMEEWCVEHPETTVVRFTSLFYNFAWIWGSDERNRHLFADWASYDFTVSPLALDRFAKTHGYSMTSEDFINKGNLQATHMPANTHKYDWMAYVNNFVIEFGKKLVDIVHKHQKLAYVFYDDSWVGLEPYGKRFKEFGFDGLIKCVFSGYEVRLCAGVDIGTHELRLHPYLFPVGLGGLPTFMEGGNPTLEAKKFWNSIRRALLRAPIDRIGLGGYLHLVEGYPDFCDYIEKVANEFRLIKRLHQVGKPHVIKTKVAVLHSWGDLRSWTLSGHFHETYMHDLIHINEALSGLPIEVQFINFQDVLNGGLEEVDVVINAGIAGSAWSGGGAWLDAKIIEIMTMWVHEGGTFLGVNEPSAIAGYDTYYRMAHILGVDQDTGAKVCHGKWQFDIETIEGLIPEGSHIKVATNRFLTDGKAQVLMAENKTPLLTINSFGQGKGIYLAGFENTLQNTRLLYNLILFAGNEPLMGQFITDNLYTECAYYPESKTLVVINNSDQTQMTSVKTSNGTKQVRVLPYDTNIIPL